MPVWLGVDFLTVVKSTKTVHWNSPCVRRRQPICKKSRGFAELVKEAREEKSSRWYESLWSDSYTLLQVSSWLNRLPWSKAFFEKKSLF